LLAAWRQLHPDLAALPAEQLPAGYRRGIQYTTYVVETPVYMPYLLDRFQALGGTVESGEVDDLDALTAGDRVVVNCTGAWAGHLTGDPHVYPIRGQIVRLAPQRQLAHGHHLFDGPLGISYIFPRGNDCVLGGTYDVGEWSRTPDAGTSAAIWERCLRLAPSLAGAQVLDVRVGLRPGRHEVRLEREARTHGIVIHNYGHGGIGFTLSWGCAAEVTKLAQEIANAQGSP
jgi:D-amino-acid oxidase